VRRGALVIPIELPPQLVLVKKDTVGRVNDDSRSGRGFLYRNPGR
jgi:hypothetical protein